MAVRDNFTPGEKLKAADLNDTFADKISNSDGYAYKTTLYYTTVGTANFVKSSYDYLRAIRVRVQGAGGGGGGCEATVSGTVAAGNGGCAGAYAESFITDIASLPGTVTVTVGDGGTGVSGSTGNTGGACSFGTIVSANGGLGGNAGVNAAPLVATSPGVLPLVAGRSNTTVATGDLVIPGAGTNTWPYISFSVVYAARGADSVLGVGGSGAGANTVSLQGNSGVGYGSGGGGGAAPQNSSAAAGGKGAKGIVIIDLFG